MNARKVLLSTSALLATTFASCGTLNRAGKDAFIGVLTPVWMVYGGSTDGVTSAQSVQHGMGSGDAVSALAFPFTFCYHAFEHLLYGVVHIVDFPLCLFYGAAELYPNGPDIKPLDIYQGTWFDDWAGTNEPKKTGTDPESGEVEVEEKPAATPN